MQRRRLWAHRSVALLCCVAAHAYAEAERGQTWTNPAGARIDIRTPQEFRISIVNRGVMKITDTTVRFLAPYTELGAYLSDPSTNYFGDLTVGSSGFMTGGAGDLFIVSG